MLRDKHNGDANFDKIEEEVGRLKEERRVCKDKVREFFNQIHLEKMRMRQLV
jgi:hypothetical protein